MAEGGRMNVGSLFSGIGGFDLGLERAGMRTVWFCEQDEFCQRVLARHWPGVPCYSDVRSLVGNADGERCSDQREGLRPFRQPDGADKPDAGQGGVPVQVSPIDVLCGGFPCQDLSVAGKGAGIEGSRSGLWSEYARLIGELRPRYVIVENVPALLARGFGRVLGDLAALGYDAEWDCIPASAFGAPHRRDRVWVVAYPMREGLEGRELPGVERSEVTGAGNGGALADPEREGREPRWSARPREAEGSGSRGGLGRCGLSGERQWATEPNVGRVANGVPARVDRLRSLGNALLPQIAEWIGTRVMEYERQKNPVRW